MRIAVCPGSFDPPTNGHLDIFERAAALFDRLVISVIANPSKQPLFSIDERVTLIAGMTAHLTSVEVVGFDGLLVDHCRTVGAAIVVKGVRNTADVDYETQMAQMNRHLTGVETVFLPASPDTSFLSGSLVREIARLGGPVDTLVPEGVRHALKEKLA